MDIETAIRATEILMGFAFIQQSLEHLYSQPNNKWIFIPRVLLSILLIVGFYSPWLCLGLFALTLATLHKFQGPYNGGSDRMSILILTCVVAIHFTTSRQWQEYIFGYLAIQLILSYFIAGFVKIVNPEWRNGKALQDVFLFSIYPASENLRQLANKPRLLFFTGWGVMIFEILFPISFITQTTLLIALLIGAIFHLANACLFGFNRFFWIWVAAYPSILWLQDRLF